MRNDRFAHLQTCLQRVVDTSVSERELTELIQIARSLVQSYLEHARRHAVYLCEQHGLSMTDVAYDCVAEAFARDDDGEFYRLQNFVRSFSTSLDSVPGDELLLAFRAFLSRFANTHVARLYALADPAGAKIHRNVRLAATQSSLFSVARGARGLVLKPLSYPVLDHLPGFPVDELRCQLQIRSVTVPQLLASVHDTLVQQSKYRRSITVVDLVQVFKRFFADAMISEDVIEQPSIESTAIDAADVVEHVERSLKEKIIVTYFSKGKLTRDQSEAMLSAFHDLLADWSALGSDDGSLYKYYSRYCATDEASFEREIRVKMSYLLKFVREELKARLLEDL